MRTTSEMLAYAEELMQRSEWCQYYGCVLVSAPEGERRCYCLLGALIVGTGWRLMPEALMTYRMDRRYNEPTVRHYAPIANGGPSRAPAEDGFFKNLTGNKRKRYVAALRYLRQVTDAEDLQEWNDREDCSREQVIEALVEAKKLALADGC